MPLADRERLERWLLAVGGWEPEGLRGSLDECAHQRQRPKGSALLGGKILIQQLLGGNEG